MSVGGGAGSGESSPALQVSSVRDRLRAIVGEARAWNTTSQIEPPSSEIELGEYPPSAASGVGQTGAPDVTADSLRRFRAAPPFATCPHCDRASCVRCKVPAHRLVTCADVEVGGESAALTTAFVAATSKKCPQCSFAITHSHGHACHHIIPGTGCPNCGTHFCYRCLRRGTSGRVCGCRLFCDTEGILANVDTFPYPADRRCGCTFCSVCRPGTPCAQCDGRCVVCLGLVPPGPTSAMDIETWRLP